MSQKFLNSANPATDSDVYLEIIRGLLVEFQQVKQPKKLVINTCGWVEGLGAEVQMSIMRAVKAICTNCKLQVITLSSMSKTSDLTLSHEEFDHITVKGDLPGQAGSSSIHFSKGSVLRNYRIFDSLAPITYKINSLFLKNPI